MKWSAKATGQFFKHFLTFYSMGFTVDQPELHQDYRPLFKQIFGSRYFNRKADELRVTRQTLWKVLSGRIVNPSILDPCIQELNERIDFLNSSWKKAKELMETHKQLRG